MPKKYALSWIPALKQWRKRRKVDGKTKTFYLGAGRGKTDLDSYATALKKWEEIERGLLRSEEAERWAAYREMLLNRPGADPADYLPAPAREVSAQRQQLWDEKENRRTKNAPAPAPSRTQKPIADYLDEYVSEQERRYKHGLKVPDAPQTKRISGTRFMSSRFYAGMLKKAWAGESLPTTEAELARIMNAFRHAQERLLDDGTIMANTYNERIKTLRHFVGWLFDNYHVPALPRKIREICARYKAETSARALDLEVIRRLWKEADGRLKTFMALGLNCGFYVSDIAALERSSIRGTHIVCARHKTGVPTRFKLWAVTSTLLEQHSAKDGKLALVADKDGGPLLRVDPNGNDGKGKRWCEIENALLALCKRLEVKKVTFSNFRDTSSTKIESINPQLTDMFDGHKDQRMARFYVDAAKIDQSAMFAALDAALDQLEALYGLPA